MGMFFMSEEEEVEVEAAPPVEEALAGLTGARAADAHDAPLAEEAHTAHTPDAPAASDGDVEAAPVQAEVVPSETVPAVDEVLLTPPPVEEAAHPPEAPAQVVDAAPAEPAVELPLPVVTDASLGSSGQEWGVCTVPLADLSALHPYVPAAYAAPVLDALGAGWAALEARGAATGVCRTLATLPQVVSW